MSNPKKIFFCYSDQEEDLDLYKRLNKHFAAYSKVGLLGIIDKSELFKLTADKNRISEILKSSDIAIPLLSIDFMNDDDCMKQFDDAELNQKTIIPVLLRDFDLAAFDKIKLYQQRMLPADLVPVENKILSGKNDDTVFKEIAQNVKAVILPEIGKIVIEKKSNTFYYVIAGLVALIGVVAAVIIFNLTAAFGALQQWLFTILCLLMFCCIGFIALKNVLFPHKLNLKQ